MNIACNKYFGIYSETLLYTFSCSLCAKCWLTFDCLHVLNTEIIFFVVPSIFFCISQIEYKSDENKTSNKTKSIK